MLKIKKGKPTIQRHLVNVGKLLQNKRWFQLLSRCHLRAQALMSVQGKDHKASYFLLEARLTELSELSGQ